MRSGIVCRQLQSIDAECFQTLRLESFRLEPRSFRFAPEDEADTPLSDFAARLQRDHVVGAFDRKQLIGVGGLAWGSGAKTRHKALLYGMYVRSEHRSHGVADAIMARLVEEARRRVERVTLSVVSENRRALRFYERWGFRAYGLEPRAAKIETDDYLDEVLMALVLKNER